MKELKGKIPDCKNVLSFRLEEMGGALKRTGVCAFNSGWARRGAPHLGPTDFQPFGGHPFKNLSKDPQNSWLRGFSGDYSENSRQDPYLGGGIGWNLRAKSNGGVDLQSLLDEFPGPSRLKMF